MGNAISWLLVGLCLGVMLSTTLTFWDAKKDFEKANTKRNKDDEEKERLSQIENWTITKTVTVGGKVEYSHTPIYYHLEAMQPYRKELIDFIRHNGATLTDEKVSAKLEQLKEQYKAAQIASTTILK